MIPNTPPTSPTPHLAGSPHASHRLHRQAGPSPWPGPVSRVVATTLALLLGASAPTVQSTEVAATIDLSTSFQTIEGWGSCLISWGEGSVPYKDPAWRQAYRDLGCNLLRVNLKKEVLVHSNNNLATEVKLGEDLAANIQRMDFGIYSVQVFGDMAKWLSENALEPERVKLIGAVWSPPHWMKGPSNFTQSHTTNTSVKKATPWLHKGTSGDSIGGRLLQEADKPGNLQQFARYLAAWVKGFEQTYGVPFYAVSLQNELIFESPFDSCTYSRDAEGREGQYWQYANALAAVKQEWTRHPSITTKILGPHNPSIAASPSNPFRLNIQMGFIDAVKNHADPTLIDFLSIYTNNYGADDSQSARMWGAYWYGKQAFPTVTWSSTTVAPGIAADGKQSWCSEAGGHAINWTGALDLARECHDFLVWGNGSAWVYWQTSDTDNKERSESLLGKSNVANPHRSAKYTAYKHFSRYIRPGSRRIEALFPGERSSFGDANPLNTNTSLNLSAFLHAADRTVTIVLVNRRDEDYAASLAVPFLPAAAQLSAYKSTDDIRFVTEAISRVGDTLLIDVPPLGIVTVVASWPALEAPSESSARALTPRSAEIRWSPLAGATGYRIYQITDDQESLAAEVGADLTSWVAGGLTPGQRHSFRIAALENEQELDRTLPVSTTTPTRLAAGAYPWTVDAWPEGQFDGWIEDWTGWVWFSDLVFPWVYHYDHGWWYVSGSRQQLWCWDASLGWLLTGADVHPFFYASDRATWLWYQAGTRAPRTFWDFATETEVKVP